MKKKIAGIAAVILAGALAFYFVTVWNAKKAMTEAVEACNAAIREYNEKIGPYNDAAQRAAAENERLLGAIDKAQAQIDGGKKAYDEDTLDELKQKVKKVSKAVVEVPAQIEPLELLNTVDSFDKEELAAGEQKARETEEAVREAAKEIPEAVEVPDFEKEIASVEKALKAYTDSVRKLANVTAPEDAFVAERLGGIGTVTGTAAVTKENDPNRLLGTKGGYIGCVYFRDKRIDLENLPEEVPSPETVALLEELQPAESGEEDEGGQPDDGVEEGGQSGDGKEDGSRSTEERKEDVRSGGGGEEAADEASTGEIGAAEETPDEASTGETGAAEEAAAEGTTENAEAASTEEMAAAAEAENDSAKAAETAATGETAAAALPEDEKAEKDRKKERKKALAIIAAGAAGGGAVEVYSTEEEARDRDQYLAFFEGSVMDPGGHTVEGTCVIRVSRHLEEAEQQELMKEIRNALLEVGQDK